MPAQCNTNLFVKGLSNGVLLCKVPNGGCDVWGMGVCFARCACCTLHVMRHAQGRCRCPDARHAQCRHAQCAQCAYGHTGMRSGYAGMRSERARACVRQRASERARASACMCMCARACERKRACVPEQARTHPPPPLTFVNYFYPPYACRHKLPLHGETAFLDTPFSLSVLTLTAQNERLCGPGRKGCLALQCIELCQRVIQV